MLSENQASSDGVRCAPHGCMARPYDIRERSRLFSDEVFVFCEHLKAKSERHVPLIDQLNDAAGSIGANLEEAKDAQSKKDFIHKNSLG
jgi:four helix bundle protein